MDIIDNIIVCNQANAYTKSRTPGGYTEIVKKTLTWDGDMTNVNDGAENIFQAPTVKLSDEYQDLNCISGFTLKFSESLGGGEIKYNREYFDSVDIIDISGGLGCLRATFTIDALNIMIYAIPAGMPEEVIAEIGVNEGVYLDVQEKDFLFVCDVYFKFETIHPIDPKYLPGVCLPVVELSQETMAGVFESGEAYLTTTEATIFYNALQNMSPVVVKGDYNGIKFSGVCNIYLSKTYDNYFMAETGVNQMQVYVAADDNGVLNGLIRVVA